MKSIKNSILLILILQLIGCQYFHKGVDKTPLAKIYDTYLYFEDIDPSIYSRKNVQDSLETIHQYIEDWAYKTLLVKQAERNVDTVKINRLVQTYHNDLLTDTYKDLLMQKYIDTVILDDTLQMYYKKYNNYFVADAAWVKPKFLVFPKNDSKKYKFMKWFFYAKPEFTDSLINNINHFSKYNITGTKWYKIPEFKKEIPVLKRINEKYILKKSKKFVLRDSLSLYLVFINDFIKNGQNLPLVLIKDDLKQLILSKRKQNSLSQLEARIKEDAINKKIFKIFKTKHKNE